MTEMTAKRHLAAMLGSFTGGTVLHLLAEVFRQKAEAHQGDGVAVKQFQEVAVALFVVGLGIDAACPHE